MTYPEKKSRGPAAAPGRIAEIDSFRAIAILGVIFIHTEPFRHLGDGSLVYWTISVLLNSLSRFAVPFFFITSGYFFAKGFKEGRPDERRYFRNVKRLLFLFLAWSIIYFVVPTSAGAVYQEGLFSAVWSHMSAVIAETTLTELVFQGTKVHLWFLIALVFAVSFAFFLHRPQLKWLFYAGATALYAAGLLSGPYASTPLGIAMDFDIRNGPFFGTFFVAIGIWLYGRNANVRVSAALSLTVLGFALQVAEAFLLNRFYGLSPFEHDYLIGTAPFGIGLMLLATSGFKSGRATRLSTIGRYSLGIYLSHFLILELSNPLSYLISGPAWEILFPAIVFASSLLLVLLLSRIPYLSRLVI